MRSFSVLRRMSGSTGPAARAAATDSGMNGSHAAWPSSAPAGLATVSRFRMSFTFLPAIRASTRACSSRSHARFLTAETPSSDTFDICSISTPASAESFSIIARCSSLSDS